MFILSADIKFEGFKAVKPNACEWHRSLTEYTDTAKVKLPAVAVLKKGGDQYQTVQTGLTLSEGLKIEITAGYNGRKVTRFRGFVSRINLSIPVEIECEGYSYQLRKKIGFTKSYVNTTVKKILTDLIEGTDILLSEAIPDIHLEKVQFPNYTGIQVLEWFKTECLLTVYFNYNVLYVGALELEAKGRVVFQLGWNTVKDNDLKFNTQREFANVKIVLESKSKKGTKTKASAGDGQTKVLKSAITDPKVQAEIAEQKRKELMNRGYEGTITAFLEPYAEPGMATAIHNTKYPERSGNYLVTSVDGSISTSGGRQKVKIGNTL